MVWFVCDDCGDSIKKPKVPQHLQQCSASRFTCLDCSRSFDRHTVKGHATCVTEVDKYAKGATKPGGYAAQGYYKDGSGATVVVAQPVASTSEPADTAYLATRPPWTCSVCKVNCTSQDTLLGHAGGVKHRRRARAAAKDDKGSEAAQQSQAETTSEVPAAVVTAMKRTADSNNEEPMVTVKKQKKSRLQADTTQAANGARLSSGDSADIAAAPTMQRLESIKWKKMALQALKSSRDNCMRLSKLQKQLRVAANVSDVLSVDADTLIASRLQGSSQFVIQGKMVSLGSSASS
ncbi:TPA: hypothetical protein ACH3X2_004567 [Trebouxia sp. C0005]